jgi:parallel beta-helix repeat protein
MVFALILILGFGTLGISAITNLNPLDVGSQDSSLQLNEEYELAYTPHDAIELHSNQDMIDLASAETWPGDGSKENPFIISGFSFNQDTQPLRIWHTTLYWVFTGNFLTSDGEGQQCGCWVENVTNGVITDNVVTNRHTGLYLMDLVNVNVTDNEIHHNLAFGIELIDSITDCNVSGNIIYNNPQGGIRIPTGAYNSIVSDNTISDCGGMGIMVLGADADSIIARNTVERSADIGICIQLSTGTIVSFNTVVNSSDHGMYLFSLTECLAFNNIIDGADDDGVSVIACELSNISVNTVRDCNGIGIDVDESENTTISWNTVQRNVGYAIQLSDTCENFDVSYNTFEDNGVICQICDEGVNNQICFNYYSDWTSPDADANGIVDEPYSADGAVNNEDPYPLAEAGVVPVVEGPTPTPTPTAAPLPMDLVMIGVGAVAVIIIVSGVVLLRRR